MPTKPRNPGTIIGGAAGQLASIVGAAGQVGAGAGDLIGAAGQVVFITRQPHLAVAMTLRAPVTPPVPQPRYTVTDRPGVAGLPQYEGRNPYQVVVPVMFDRLATFTSVEGDIRTLEQMAVRHQGMTGPPVVEITGPIPAPVDVADPTWRITGFTELPERTEFNGQGQRCRWAVDISLSENVTDTLLQSTATKAVNASGVHKKTVTVHDGETNLHQVAKRLGGKPTAKQIAEKNNLNLAVRLETGMVLHLP